MLVDTHLHLIDRRRLSYPWLAAVPALDRDWSYGDYAASAARVGIATALHMEVDVAEPDIDAETAMVRELMARPGSLIGGAISAARPEAPGFRDWLDRLGPEVKGLRRVLHVVPDAVSQDPKFRDGVRAMGRAGLPFDLCVLARQLPLACDLADACPDTQFVLDHCGNPDIAGAGFDAWAPALADLAQRENVNAKISGLLARTGPDWSVATLRPYVEHVVGCFGWDRVVWGSDSPVVTLGGTLAEWVAATRALLQGAGGDEWDRLARRNAQRIWRLGGA